MALAPEPAQHKFDSAPKIPSDMVDEDVGEEEEDGDLFEINLEVVNKIPPPHYWESYFTATTNTLLANCLLPIADVSSAVPMVMRACDALLPWPAATREDQPVSIQGANVGVIIRKPC